MRVATRPRVVIGATALAGLAALGGVGVVLDQATSRAAHYNVTEIATTTNPAPGNPTLAKLFSLLPSGFDSSNCAAVRSPPTDSLATVDCDKNLTPNGPTGARFSLYPDQSVLANHFESGASADIASPCPGRVKSPGTWHYDNTPNDVAGQIICGTYNGKPDLLWSQNAELLLGDIQGADIDSLYQWWVQNS